MVNYLAFRFNKAQQDAFLPYVEAGHIVFIGATTENPSFEINAALLSRCTVLTLNKLQAEHIRTLSERAVADKEKGVLVSIAGSSPGDIIKVDKDALEFLAGAADGDARVALNSLEIAGMAAFAAWQSTPRRSGPEERGSSSRSDFLVKLDGEREGCTEGTGVKREASSSVVAIPPTNSRLERSGSGFGMKRLEVLKEGLKKENSLKSDDDYTRPFKRFVGGKEVTRHTHVKEAVKETSSVSTGSGGEPELEGGASLRDVGGRDGRDKDGGYPLGTENSERKGGRFEGTWEPLGSNGGGPDVGKVDKNVIVVTLQQVSLSTSYTNIFLTTFEKFRQTSPHAKVK